MNLAAKSSALTVAKDFIKFVDASPSPYHAVGECRQRLVQAGFVEIREKDPWNVSPNQKYFMTKNQSTIIAFAVGGKYKPGNGFSIFGAHTDSPCLRVKVKSNRKKQGFIQVGTECYGGGNWGTWFDRDLKLAGRLIVADKENPDQVQSMLVHINKPIMRVPHLAIHLQREMNEKFSINKENHLVPIIATEAEMLLNQPGSKEQSQDGSLDCSQKHSSVLMDALSKHARVSMKSIIDFDLFLADHQPSVIGGFYDEFIFAPRLDNLLSCYTGLQGLIQSCNDSQSLAQDPNIRMIAFFDNEEVGSASAQGAGSSLTEYVMRRLAADKNNPCTFEESIPKSYMISADMAHGIHPNYADKHEENLRPSFHDGPVIKVNNNQRYATTAVTASLLRQVARHADVPLQDVMVRNDAGCGSTIGPILSTRLGMRTVDVGGAQLSMHSCREVCGVYTPQQCVKLYKTFFEKFPSLDEAMFIE